MWGYNDDRFHNKFRYVFKIIIWIKLKQYVDTRIDLVFYKKRLCGISLINVINNNNMISWIPGPYTQDTTSSTFMDVLTVLHFYVSFLVTRWNYIFWRSYITLCMMQLQYENVKADQFMYRYKFSLYTPVQQAASPVYNYNGGRRRFNK